MLFQSWCLPSWHQYLFLHLEKMASTHCSHLPRESSPPGFTSAFLTGRAKKGSQRPRRDRDRDGAGTDRQKCRMKHLSRTHLASSSFLTLEGYRRQYCRSSQDTELHETAKCKWGPQQSTPKDLEKPQIPGNLHVSKSYSCSLLNSLIWKESISHTSIHLAAQSQMACCLHCSPIS